MSDNNSPSLPDQRGRFGMFGGKFVPETLMAALDELESAYEQASASADFQAELDPVIDDLRRPAHTPVFCRKSDPPLRRGQDLSQA